MGLEVANDISQLVESNPLGTDNRSQGDDHIRLIKRAVKQTFPEVKGVVTASHTQLNRTTDNSQFCFPGMIVMWSGTMASIPAGWKLCDGAGTISNGNPVPDLRSRFVIGAGADFGNPYNTNQTGGSTQHVVSGRTGGTALTIAQMPPHSHGVREYAGTNGGSPGINSPVFGTAGTRTSTEGAGQAHDHAISATINVVPPYWALAFIIKE